MKTSWQHKIQELGGIFSVALSVGLRLPGVTWHPAQWSPDFPPLYRCGKTATAQPTLVVNYTLLLIKMAIKKPAFIREQQVQIRHTEELRSEIREKTAQGLI